MAPFGYGADYTVLYDVFPAVSSVQRLVTAGFRLLQPTCVRFINTINHHRRRGSVGSAWTRGSARLTAAGSPIMPSIPTSPTIQATRTRLHGRAIYPHAAYSPWCPSSEPHSLCESAITRPVVYCSRLVVGCRRAKCWEIPHSDRLCILLIGATPLLCFYDVPRTGVWLSITYCRGLILRHREAPMTLLLSLRRWNG